MSINVITEDRASGAQFIDGSLKIVSSSDTAGSSLRRTPGSEGNRKTWTWSAWVKREKFDSEDALFASVDTNGNSDYTTLYFNTSNQLKTTSYQSSSTRWSLTSERLFRDTGWYHIVLAVDLEQSENSDKVKVYVNGSQITFSSATYPSTDFETRINSTNDHSIGRASLYDRWYADFRMSQVYLIDGAALEPENFGFTDPLTNTWRPKKYKHRTDLYGVTWSSALTDADNASNGFDGSTATITTSNHSGYPQIMTFTPVGGIKFNTSIEVYVTNAGTKVNVNGEGLQTISDDEWVTVKTGPGTLNTLVFQRNSSKSAKFAGIRVDGHILIDNQNDNSFYLPMDGNSPIGQDQSGAGNNWSPVKFGGSNSIEKATGALPILNTTNGGNVATAGTRPVDEGYPNTGINDGTVWSTATVSGDGSIDGSYPVANAFNGYLTGNNMRSSGTNTNITLTLPKSIPFTSSIRIYHNQNGTAKINSESTVSLTGGGANWVTVYSGSGTFSSLTLTSTSGDTISLFAVEVDGEILVDGHGLVLALPLIGNANDVSNQINSASSTKTVTASGDAAASSDKSNFYGGSFEFDGSGDYLNTGYSVDSTFAQGDYTIEFWFYSEDDQNEKGLFGLTGNQYGIAMRHFGSYSSGGNKTLSAYFDGTTKKIEITNRVQDRWIHVAMVKNGSTGTLYVDGESQGTVSIGTPTVTTSNFYVGTYYAAGSYGFNGYIQDFRVYTTAKYTSDFIPARTDPTILPDTPSGVSGKSKLTKITDGAVHFDASGDYLSMADSSDFAFGTGDFTAECFIYPKGNVNYRAIIDCRDQVSDPNGWILGVNAADQIYIYTDGFLLTSADGNTVTTEDKWYHVAYVRNSGTHKLYVDGKEVDSSSTSIDYNTDNCVIGASYAKNSEYWNGFISNVRLVKGTAVYTSDFTPPTEPLTNVTNTKLLCCQSNISATAYEVSPGAITANGDATATNFNPFNTDINTVRGQETGYCTWNPLTRYAGSAYTLSDGNLKAVKSGGNVVGLNATFSVEYGDTGKYYWEADHNLSPTHGQGIGWGDDEYFTYTYGTGFKKQLYYLDTSCKFSDFDVGNTTVGSSLQSNFGNTLGIAFDLDANTMYFYVDGVLQATATGVWGTYFATTDRLFPCLYGNGTNNNGTVEANFGQKPFKFPPPDGFQPLSLAAVRPETVIARPDQYVGVTTYTGSGAARDIKLGRQPDLVWTKQRAGGSLSGGRTHELIDSVRGTEKALVTSSTDDEYTSTGSVTSFNYDGYTLGSEDRVNENNATYVAWTWKAGGNKNTFNIDDVGYASAAAANMNTGSANSGFYDQSEEWQDRVSFSGGTYTAGTIDTAFDGDLTTGITDGNNQSSVALLLTFTPAITATSSLRVFTTGNAACPVVVNGSQTLTNGGSGSWDTVSSNSLSTVSVKHRSGQGLARLRAIEVDGKILVDASQTPAGTQYPSIAPSGCSVGTKQGFSIIGYTGTDNTSDTFSHGLSQKPDFAIFKNRSQAGDDWIVYHSSQGATKRGKLNLTNTFDSQTSQFNDTEPTSSLFTIGTYDNINKLNNNYIAYIWHSVPGVQKFGKYIGTGFDSNNKEPFIELGFRPKLIWIKSTTLGHNWVAFDSERGVINPVDEMLFLNKTDQEAALDSSDTNTGDLDFDILSNGFKLRTANHSVNKGSSDTYIYCAWAEAPSTGFYGSRSNAR